MFKSLIDLLFPPKCPLCDEVYPDRAVCKECGASLNHLEGDFTAPYLDRVWFSRARSCFAYEGKLMDAVHGLKYSRRFDLVAVLSGYLAKEAESMGAYDAIVPVPVHWWRLWRRGYNQSALLARAVGGRLGVKVECGMLSKKRLVHPQVGLSREERLRNMRGAFIVNSKYVGRYAEQKILLMDDVLTTGSTANECAKTLIKQGGCAVVDVLTVARTI